MDHIGQCDLAATGQWILHSDNNEQTPIAEKNLRSPGPFRKLGPAVTRPSSRSRAPAIRAARCQNPPARRGTIFADAGG